MKYLKLFENYDEPLFYEIPDKEYNSFTDRRTSLDIEPLMPKIQKLYDEIFGEFQPYNFDGTEYKPMEIYKDHGIAHYVNYTLPIKERVGTPPAMNIISTDDDWFLVVYFPANKTPYKFGEGPDNICYKVDTLEGLEELFYHLKEID